MNLDSLNSEHDKLQRIYGARELSAVYNGGCIDHPDVCFVFMNPTGRNPSASPSWKGRRAPWIGTKNIWKLFYQIGLLSDDVFNSIQQLKPNHWTEEFADNVYNDVNEHKVFITNLGKCTQLDARPLPDSVYLEYLDLLYQEIDIVRPKLIVSMGNQVSSILLERKISVSQCRRRGFTKDILGHNYAIYPVYYPVGNGMMNMNKAVEDLTYILSTIK